MVRAKCHCRDAAFLAFRAYFAALGTHPYGSGQAPLISAYPLPVGDFLFAHEAVVSAIALCLKRFGGKKWPAGIDKDVAEKNTQVAQLSMYFMHGVDLCEIAIAEGVRVTPD